MTYTSMKLDEIRSITYPKVQPMGELGKVNKTIGNGGPAYGCDQRALKPWTLAKRPLAIDGSCAPARVWSGPGVHRRKACL